MVRSSHVPSARHSPGLVLEEEDREPPGPRSKWVGSVFREARVPFVLDGNYRDNQKETVPFGVGTICWRFLKGNPKETQANFLGFRFLFPILRQAHAHIACR